MDIQKTKNDTTLTLAIQGRIDTTTAPQLEAELRSDIDGVTELYLDFTGVEYISSAGLRVLVLEKRERPARKILVTGKGRCNVTNHCSPQEFIAAVRRNPRFLMSAIYAMTPQDTMACFEELGMALKTERGSRVFPVSDRAMDIADALVRFARQGGVQILSLIHI